MWQARCDLGLPGGAETLYGLATPALTLGLLLAGAAVVRLRHLDAERVVLTNKLSNALCTVAAGLASPQFAEIGSTPKW